MLGEDRLLITGLEEKVVQHMQKSGWPQLTAIQRTAFPVLLRRRNALLVAPTGSGKTEAAVIPIFTLLSSRKASKPGVRMLYITPLRALNRDIFRRVLGYAEDVGLTTDIRHGDTPAAARKRMLVKPPDILITTPETLAILLTSPRMKLHLRNLEWVVVDELHELLGNERGAHLAISLERLEDFVGKPITRVGLSATVGDAREAGRFLVGSKRKCAILVDSTVRKYDVECVYVDGSLIDAAGFILRYVMEGEGAGKSTLLFTNTRDEAEFLGAVLKARAPAIPIEVHHGSLSREMREETEAKLRSGEPVIVVSTSSLELGLDIGSVNLVVLWGSPRQAVKMIQRVGRSRHTLREVATGVLVTNRLDEELEGIALINRLHKGSLEATAIHHNALDVLGHQLVGLVLERGVVAIDEAVTEVRKALPFEGVMPEDLVACLQILEKQGVVRFDGEIIRRRGPKTYEYYYENISTIPDIQQFQVVDVSSKKTIGRLDQLFVGEYGEPGKPFVLKGNSWKIVSIDDEKQIVHVEPLPRDITTVPYWIGELIPIDYYTAQEVGRLRRLVVLGEGYPVSPQQTERLLKTQQTLKLLPDERHIVIEKKSGSNTLVIHACLGTKTNQTLATLFSTLLSSKIGYLVEARSDAYRIVLSSQGRLEPRHVLEAFRERVVNMKEILSTAVIGTHPLNWKTWYVAKKFGVIDRQAQYDRRASRIVQERYRNTALYHEVLRELFLEKYDVPRALQVLEDVLRGKIRLVAVEVEDFTPLAKPILEYMASFAALPMSVEKTVLDLVRERLENSKHRLVCLSCGKWETVVKTRDVREPPVCPVCRSRIMADTYVSDAELITIVQKKNLGKALTPEEEQRFKRAWKTSSLLQTFGRPALVVLSGFGVGADTAARILRRTLEEEELYRNIYQAEKLYVSTRSFWEE